MKYTEKIVIVDYGMGNLKSVFNALKFLEIDCTISQEPREVETADALILPGVGSFRLAMLALQERGLSDAIAETVMVRQRKILGICLGFQMLGQSSTEDGYSKGLGLIEGVVEPFSQADLKGRKLPHIGFNQVVMPSSDGLFSGFDTVADFYFVHSYRILPSGLSGQSAICNYGTNFVAAYQKANIFGTQFHPEKSQTNGLRLLANFFSA